MCVNCQTIYYNSTNSSSADVSAPNATTQHNYGDLTLVTVKVEDKVCALADECEKDDKGVETIEFGAIKAISKLNYEFDGLFGLAPQKDGRAPNYIENLSASTGLKQVVTLDVNTPSLILGGIPDGLVQGESSEHKMIKTVLDSATG